MKERTCPQCGYTFTKRGLSQHVGTTGCAKRVEFLKIKKRILRENLALVEGGFAPILSYEAEVLRNAEFAGLVEIIHKPSSAYLAQSLVTRVRSGWWGPNWVSAKRKIFLLEGGSTKEYLEWLKVLGTLDKNQFNLFVGFGPARL